MLAGEQIKSGRLSDKVLTNAEEIKSLMSELKLKKKQGFIFRGQEDAEWLLTPSLFRKSQEKIEETFFDHPTIINELNSIFGGRDITITKENYRWCYLFYKKEKIPLIRLLRLVLFITKYNSSLHNYIVSNKEKYNIDLYEDMTDGHSCQDWLSVNIFCRLLQDYWYSMDLYGVEPNAKGELEIINKPSVCNELTGFDCDRPQHYDVATSLLDWTRNPLVSLYFSMRSFINDKGKPYASLNVAIYAYRDINNVSILVKKADERVDNERQVKQEGLFTVLPRAPEYYLFNGSWPSMDDYCDEKNCDLIKYRITLSGETLSIAKRLLDDEGVNEKSLGLE